MLKPHPGMVIGLSLLSLVLIPALACNLPAQQAGGLSFPKEQAQTTSPNLPFPISETASAPAFTKVPALPTIALVPGVYPYSFRGLQTATPGPGVPTSWIIPAPGEALPPFTYWSQPGDTLTALAARFGVSPDQISPAQPSNGLLEPGQKLTIPNLLGEPPYPSPVFPDSVVINSPAAAGFRTDEFITQAGGYLSTYREQAEPGEWLTGSEIVQRVAADDSINPQLLLAFLEFRSGRVRGEPTDPGQVEYPIGFDVPDYPACIRNSRWWPRSSTLAIIAGGRAC